MQKNCLLILLVLLSIGAGYSSVEARVLNNYVLAGGDLHASVEISEDYTGTADLKFCLADFDFNTLSYNYRCDIFLERFNITFDKNYSSTYTFSLEGVQPLIYRLFVQLHFNTTYHKDSDSNNFVYVASSGEPIVYVYNYSGVAIDSRAVNSIVERGSTVTNCINITLYENCTNLRVYSFIHNDSISITGELNSNIQSFSLPVGSSTQVCLNNTIISNASIGAYDYVSRVASCTVDYETKSKIYVIEKKTPYYNAIIENNSLIIKNYDESEINYIIELYSNDSANIVNGSILPHNQKTINLNLTDFFIRLSINNEASLEGLYLSNNTNIVIINNSILPITAAFTAKNSDDYNLYAISLLTSAAALIILYVKIK
jgi:hypothetical protein